MALYRMRPGVIEAITFEEFSAKYAPLIATNYSGEVEFFGKYVKLFTEKFKPSYFKLAEKWYEDSEEDILFRPQEVIVLEPGTTKGFSIMTRYDFNKNYTSKENYDLEIERLNNGSLSTQT